MSLIAREKMRVDEDEERQGEALMQQNSHTKFHLASSERKREDEKKQQAERNAYETMVYLHFFFFLSFFSFSFSFLLHPGCAYMNTESERDEPK